VPYREQFNVIAEPLHPADWQILQLITGSFEHRPWASKEIYSQIGASPRDVLDGMLRLCDVRLIQSVESYLIPTRAAVYYHRLSALAQDPEHSQRPSHCARR
jgi:hypothetical protein